MAMGLDYCVCVYVYVCVCKGEGRMCLVNVYREEGKGRREGEVGDGRVR